jgi:hypothetical protein
MGAGRASFIEPARSRRAGLTDSRADALTAFGLSQAGPHAAPGDAGHPYDQSPMPATPRKKFIPQYRIQIDLYSISS